jgi:hypothetical protein
MQMREELEAQAKLGRDQSNLAFGSAQADIDQAYNEMATRLRASREQMEVCASRGDVLVTCLHALQVWRGRPCTMAVD